VSELSIEKSSSSYHHEEAFNACGEKEGASGVLAPGLSSCLSGTQSLDEIDLVGNLGLDVIREPVAVVAREDFTAGSEASVLGGPHHLDVVMVVGVDNGRDVEVGHAVPATEVDLAEHTGDVGGTLLDSVVVADPSIGEGDNLLGSVADSDGGEVVEAGVGSEVDGSLNAVQSDKGDGSSEGSGRGGDESGESSSELHCCGWCVGFVVVCCWSFL
jgi:hypothetical protein